MKTKPNKEGIIIHPIVYVTKYALTDHTIRVYRNAEIDPSISATMIAVRPASGGMHMCFHGNDWYTSEAAARARCVVMRETRWKSLEKQMEKLRKMTMGSFKLSEASE